MKTKEKKAYLNELENFGSAYIGSMEIMGTMKIVKRYESLRRYVEKQMPGKTLAMNNEDGTCWIV